MTTAVEAKARSQTASPHPKAVPSAGTRRARRRSSATGPIGIHQSHPEASASPEFSSRHIASSGPVPGWKRGLDLICILLSLPVTLPLMAAITLWIKCASRGPALFRQERIGRNGKRFVLYKFRSMKVNADPQRHRNHFSHLVQSDSPMVKLDLLCDSRLIPGGCLLRAAGLDELPQLLNVLRGEMSLVGPRPCLPEEFRFFSPKQRERFECLPGLTGIWQVHGKGISTFSEMNAMDALYVRRSSLMLDLGIMLRTPIALLRQMHEAFLRHRGNAEKPVFAAGEEAALSGYTTQRLG